MDLSLSLYNMKYLRIHNCAKLRWTVVVDDNKETTEKFPEDTSVLEFSHSRQICRSAMKTVGITSTFFIRKMKHNKSFASDMVL
jgi:hypothetical protein